MTKININIDQADNGFIVRSYVRSNDSSLVGSGIESLQIATDGPTALTLVSNLLGIVPVGVVTPTEVPSEVVTPAEPVDEPVA